MFVFFYFEFFFYKISICIWFIDRKFLELNNFFVLFNNSNFNVVYLELM